MYLRFYLDENNMRVYTLKGENQRKYLLNLYLEDAEIARDMRLIPSSGRTFDLDD
uniref:Arm-DNA-bind_5 domain-containing protein n=1 Tax=Heterorhabditis bacteriophora TaxID=37862 RepID=A0A1I7WNY8_HETBA